MSREPRFSNLSAPRQDLLRFCQSINYGDINNFVVRDHEPVPPDPECVVLVDVKLDSEERPRPEADQAALDGFANKEGVGEMQMRSTNLDHHHQEGLVGSARSSPEADLLALARSKGQPLTEHTLRLIRETLELRGVSLEAFVADVRPHFRNNILNPSGFLINRARRFHELARPAQVRVAATTAGRRQRNYARFAKVRNLSSERRKSSLAQHCSTPDFRHAWERKEAERRKRAGLRGE